jgi:hypothetical protein
MLILKVNMKRFKQIIKVLFIFSILTGFLQSCQEELEDPRAIVTVVHREWVDTAFVEVPILNARVKFAPPQDASLPDIVKYVDHPELTDVNGEAEFVTQHEAIIELIAEGEVAINDSTIKTFHGEGVIILLKDEVDYETIRLE